MKKKKAAPKKSKKTAPKKAKPKAKKTVKAKKTSVAKRPGKAKAKAAPKPKVKAAKKETESHGLTVVDLFRMKQEREQQAAQDAEAWKHKKDLPAQDQHAPEDAKGPAGKKSGFGGVRHH